MCRQCIQSGGLFSAMNACRKRRVNRVHIISHKPDQEKAEKMQWGKVGACEGREVGTSEMMRR